MALSLSVQRVALGLGGLSGCLLGFIWRANAVFLLLSCAVAVGREAGEGSGSGTCSDSV